MLNSLVAFSIRLKFSKKYNNGIEFLSRLVTNSFNLCRFIVVTLFAWSIGTICCTMLFMQVQLAQQQQGGSASHLTLVTKFGLTMWSFALVLGACEFGHKLNDAYEQIDDKIVQFNWYHFPTDVRKMLPLFMGSAQQMIDLSVFGSIACDRENFKNVCHKLLILIFSCLLNVFHLQVVNHAFSYFMVLRQFGH